MKKTYILIIICLIVLSYFGTKLVTNLNDYTIQKSVEISKKNNAPTIECNFRINGAGFPVKTAQSF